MIKKLLITLILFYQKLISPLFHHLLGTQQVCRYTVTCSDYAKEVIERNGWWKGILLAGKRILSCQPYAKAI